MDYSGPTYKYVCEDMICVFGKDMIGYIKRHLYMTNNVTFAEYFEITRLNLIKKISEDI